MGRIDGRIWLILVVAAAGCSDSTGVTQPNQVHHGTGEGPLMATSYVNWWHCLPAEDEDDAPDEQPEPPKTTSLPGEPKGVSALRPGGIPKHGKGVTAVVWSCHQHEGPTDDGPDDFEDGGKSGSSGGDSESPHESYECPNCSGLSSTMEGDFLAALTSGSGRVVVSSDFCEQIRQLAEASVVAGAWGHTNYTGTSWSWHHTSAHSDPSRKHFSIHTSYPGFTGVSSSLDQDQRKRQLAGVAMHEMMHHELPFLTETEVDKETARCVPGYETLP